MIMRDGIAVRRVAQPPIPDSIAHPPSRKSNSADPFLYGGVAAIVGILGLITGGVLALLGNLASGAILAGLGAILFGAGFLVARRGQ